MALDALWAVLTPEVSRVSRVQAPIHTGFTDTPAVLREVSGVSGIHEKDRGMAGIGGIDTPATPQKNMRYHTQPAWALGCTLDTPDTCKTINVEANAVSELLTQPPTEPKRVFRPCGPWVTDQHAMQATAYHLHHLNCIQCIAAGRGAMYGLRCGIGLGLWGAYEGSEKDWLAPIEI